MYIHMQVNNSVIEIAEKAQETWDASEAHDRALEEHYYVNTLSVQWDCKIIINSVVHSQSQHYCNDEFLW